MTLPPPSPHATRARNYAHAKGWLPPLAWDNIDDPGETHRIRTGSRHQSRTDVDPVVVTRFVEGEFTLPTSHAEKIEITRRWVQSGKTLYDLERRTGWKPERYLKLSDEVA